MSQQPLFHHREVWHSWWRVPLWMTFWTFVALTPFVLLITRSSCSYCRAPSLLQMLAPALAIAGVIGLIGLLCGLHYTSSAQAKAAEDFGPSTLSCDHWLSQRVGVLAERLSLPLPAVGAMTTCNAYAVGKDPDHAAVVLGQPLIQALAPEELDAVTHWTSASAGPMATHHGLPRPLRSSGIAGWCGNMGTRGRPSSVG